MSETTELLPCPFCGGEAKLFDEEYSDETGMHFREVFILCGSCETSQPVTDDRAEAIAAWNRRSTPSPPASGGEVETIPIRKRTTEEVVTHLAMKVATLEARVEQLGRNVPGTVARLGGPSRYK